MDESIDKKNLHHRLSVLKNQATFDTDSYEFDESVTPFNGDPSTAKTLDDIVQCLEGSSDCTIEARVISIKNDGTRTVQEMGKDAFLESYKKNESSRLNFKESCDNFSTDADPSSRVGDDTINTLGGPFNKQLYQKDYLKMHATCFHAYHHDPMGRSVVHIIRDFTLGRGFKVNCESKVAQAIWDAFSEVNNLDQLMEYVAIELSIYGESMLWWLPGNEEYISYQVSPDQMPKSKFLPRIRLIDPSVIWEIVTYPEDITRVLFYQWVAPTQYQTYTGKDAGKSVPGSKFIYQQIPADQVDHFKINCASNEKRGRSDLFPALGYMKRLRDSVNYSIIGMQKNAAWAIDTKIEGSQADIDAYVASQEALGTIPPAGSEFVHSAKVTREMLSAQGAGKSVSNAFDWAMSMVAIATGIPVQYFGSHLSGQGTRGNAIVATEPVTKKFEARQLVYERIIRKMATRLFKTYGIETGIEVTFPEIIIADRSQKLKDLLLAQSSGWLSKERCAEIAAKEFNVTDFNYDDEKVAIESDVTIPPEQSNPLSSLGSMGISSRKTSITSQDKKDLSDHEGY